MNTATCAPLAKRILQGAYGLFFVGLLPIFLIRVARGMSLALPAYSSMLPGLALILLGCLCMGAGALALFIRGKGLPMNAFPPERLVTGGVYAVLPHPIYCGFVFASAGLSLVYGSAAGLWVITPLSALGCAALVWGYERPYLQSRHHACATPWMGMNGRRGLIGRMGLMLGVMLPWLVQFHAIKLLGAPPDAMTLLLPGEASWPVLPWTYPLYAAAYVFVPLAFFLAPYDAAQRLFRRGWTSLALMTLLYLCIPLVSPVRGFEPQGLLGAILHWEMAAAYPYTAAFPSYHVVWCVLAAAAVAERGRYWAAGAWLLALGISVTCVTTGMHVFADIPAGLLTGLLLCGQERIWQRLLQLTEKLANSLTGLRLGSWRVLSHAPCSFLAGFLCLFLPGVLLGGKHALLLGALLAAGILAAAVWGQFIEGASRLQRPFGYFGGALAMVLAGAGLLLLGYPAWPVLAAIACSAPWIQAAGRLRCLIQGCCHGRCVEPDALRTHGIVVNNPASRVSSLSNLHGRAIYPTQLYSLLGNAAIGLLLLRLWQLGAGTACITGLYFILSGLLRFVEEGYRGESQTPMRYGLPIYQWLAVLMVFFGACLLTAASPRAPETAFPEAWAFSLLMGCIGGVLVTLAMSVDFPGSDKRFARLSEE